MFVPSATTEDVSPCVQALKTVHRRFLRDSGRALTIRARDVETGMITSCPSCSSTAPIYMRLTTAPSAGLARMGTTILYPSCSSTAPMCMRLTTAPSAWLAKTGTMTLCPTCSSTAPMYMRTETSTTRKRKKRLHTALTTYICHVYLCVCSTPSWIMTSSTTLF